MTNSVDPDQTAPKEQFDLGLHCLLRYVDLNSKGKYRNLAKEIIITSIKEIRKILTYRIHVPVSKAF